ncbi:N,N-dimethylformamidase beta subunit family domain-containing protein [Neotabrizicola sp. sgz301269]|uniref:N,N-dimethylformamidase beta subunit family domain-containing protein n=1 Tax=Neotabrizicola sp. sgz301269 TaxID=3276282 RepID=UPI00376F7AAC
MSLKGFFVTAPHDDDDPVTGHFYEMASADPNRPQVWAYTDAVSYAPGDRLALHAMSSAPRAHLQIARDGISPHVVLSTEIGLSFETTPEECSVSGCNWPERFALIIPQDWASGVYTVTLSVPGHDSQHMFVLRAARPAAKICMILATGTWCAYNDWGGSNHYQGLTGPNGADFAPNVSVLRPWATGFVRWPADAPRIPYASPLLAKPRYPHMEYARSRTISKKYASSGWAAFERPFALWCEAQGIALDFATQHDLHRDPHLLDGYDRALIVGHDEYWTWEMRDHLDAWLDAGGELARFAGNFFWQTRLSPDLRTQTCYKTRARAEDPVRDSDPARLSTYWDYPGAARPAAATMGLTGAMGVYAGWSRCAAHGAGGFTIYRPDHWCLHETGLGYGDVLGAQSRIFGYEVDGIDYTMTHGLPFAAEGTGLQGALIIIGLSPATTLAHSAGRQDRDTFIGTLDAEEVAEWVYGELTPETFGRASRGNGCMAEYRRGKGAVFNAGSCEWVAGLIARERPVEAVTRRVLTGRWG